MQIIHHHKGLKLMNRLRLHIEQTFPFAYFFEPLPLLKMLQLQLRFYFIFYNETVTTYFEINNIFNILLLINTEKTKNKKLLVSNKLQITFKRNMKIRIHLV